MEEKNNFENEYIFRRQNRIMYKLMKLKALDYKARMKVEHEIMKIENELDEEEPNANYQEYKRKRTRNAQSYLRNQDLKTNCAVNAEEDLFEIEGGKAAIKENLLRFEIGQQVVCLMKRKKIKGFLMAIEENMIVIRTHDKKRLELTYKQIDVDKIRFAVE